jgi:hypothetical protein
MDGDLLLVGGLGGRCWSGVVLAGSLQDRGVDQADHVLAGTQSGRLDHRLHPSAPSDDAGGRVVVIAIEVGAGSGTRASRSSSQAAYAARCPVTRRRRGGLQAAAPRARNGSSPPRARAEADTRSPISAASSVSRLGRRRRAAPVRVTGGRARVLPKQLLRDGVCRASERSAEPASSRSPSLSRARARSRRSSVRRRRAEAPRARAG